MQEKKKVSKNLSLTNSFGEYKSYYELSKDSINSSEQLYIICNYIDDKLQGEYKTYCINGELSVIYNYINDKKEGEYKSYYQNGKLKNIYNYINNKKEG